MGRRTGDDVRVIPTRWREEACSDTPDSNTSEPERLSGHRTELASQKDIGSNLCPAFSQALVGAALLHRGLTHILSLRLSSIFLQIIALPKWAMLGSNQRPLPCEGSTIGCWRCQEICKIPANSGISALTHSLRFRRFTRVAARLLHRR